MLLSPPRGIYNSPTWTQTAPQQQSLLVTPSTLPLSTFGTRKQTTLLASLRRSPSSLRCPTKQDPAIGLLVAITSGGFLGLYNSQSYNKSMQTATVEFDTYQNPWDPQNRHIKMDVNTIKSIKKMSWGLSNNQVAKILITFNASTNLLVASLVHPSRKTSYILSEVVDLKSVLPEWVKVRTVLCYHGME
ncbi:Lectin alpha chain [Spatholobus suberectus]|nr:Lectin alpha chain [Spatholobus suberectus]